MICHKDIFNFFVSGCFTKKEKCDMKKVYVEGNDFLLVKMFAEEGWDIAPDIWGADLLCLEGGADVQPALYGEKNTHSGVSPNKDIQSLGLISVAEMLEIPIVGVCRGGQILNVRHGGGMIQHVDGHALGARTHEVVYRDVVYQCASAHHQEMVPSYCFDQEVYTDGHGGVEIIVSLAGGYLCFQPHPEYKENGHESRTLFFKLIERIM